MPDNNKELVGFQAGEDGTLNYFNRDDKFNEKTNDAFKNTTDEDIIGDQENFEAPDMGDFYLGAVDTDYLEKLDAIVNGANEKERAAMNAAFYTEIPMPISQGMTPYKTDFIKVKPDLSDHAIEMGWTTGNSFVARISDLQSGDGEPHGGGAGGANTRNFLTEYFTKEGNKEVAVRYNDFGSLREQDLFQFRMYGITCKNHPVWAEESGVNPDHFHLVKMTLKEDIVTSPDYIYIRTGRQLGQEVDFVRLGSKYHEVTRVNKTETGVSFCWCVMNEETDYNKKAAYYMRELIEKKSDDGFVYMVIEQDAHETENPRLFTHILQDSEAREVLGKWSNGFYHFEEGHSWNGYPLAMMDTTGRLSGVAYIKIDGQWCNLAKMMLANSTNIDAEMKKPNPKNQKFFPQNYDIKASNYADAFKKLVDDIDDRPEIQKKIFGKDWKELHEWTVTIGDTTLFIPPSHINISTEIEEESMPIIRASGSSSSQKIKYYRTISMEVYFYGEHGINGYEYKVTTPGGQVYTYYINGLRGLLSQFKFTPFLPIENEYINNVLGISAVTMHSINVESITEIGPKLLRAVITMTEFDYNTMIPEHTALCFDLNLLEGNIFAKAFNWETFRYYYQRPLMAGMRFREFPDINNREYNQLSLYHRTAYEPFIFKEKDFKLYVADEDELNEILQYRRSLANGKIDLQLTDDEVDLFEDLSKLSQAIAQVMASEPYQALASNNSNSIYHVECVGKDSRPGSKWEGLTSRSKGFQYDYMHVSYAENNFHKNLVTLKNLFNNAFQNTDFKKIKASVDDIEEGENYDFVCRQVKYETAGDANDGGDWRIQAVNLGYCIEIKLSGDLFENNFNATRNKIAKMAGLKTDTIFTNNTINIPFWAPVYDKNSATSGQSTNYEECKKSMYIKDFYADNDAPDLKALLAIVKRNKIESKNKKLSNGDSSTNWRESPWLLQLREVEYKELPLGNFEVIKYNFSTSNKTIMINAMESEGSAPQYLGGEDTYFDLYLQTRDPNVVSTIVSLPGRMNGIMKKYREIIPTYPLRINSEFTRFASVRDIMIKDISVDTVPKQPGVYAIKISFKSIDRTLRSREALKRISANNDGEVMNGEAATQRINTYLNARTILGNAEVYPDLELPTLAELERIGYSFVRYKFQDNRVYVDPDFYFLYFNKLTAHAIRNCILEISGNDDAHNIMLTDDTGAKVEIKAAAYKAYDIIGMNNTASNQVKSIRNAKKAMNDLSAKKITEIILDNREKNTKNLYDTWNIGEHIICSFMEPNYKDEAISYETEINNQPVNGSKEKIAEGKWVYGKLENARKASKAISDYLENNPIPQIQDSEKYCAQEKFQSWKKDHATDTLVTNLYKDVETKINEAVKKMLSISEVTNILKLINIDPEKSKDLIAGVIYSAACAETGRRPFSHAKSDNNWRPALDYYGVALSGFANDNYARQLNNLEDAVNEAAMFGPYNIRLYERKTIEKIAGLALENWDMINGVVNENQYDKIKVKYEEYKNTLKEKKEALLKGTGDKKELQAEIVELESIVARENNRLKRLEEMRKKHESDKKKKEEQEQNQEQQPKQKPTGPVCQINTGYYLLDPYYRVRNEEDIREYKKNCISDVTYATCAYFRLVLLYLQQLIDDKTIPSISADILRDASSNMAGAISTLKELNATDPGNHAIANNIMFFKKKEPALSAGKIWVATILAMTNKSETFYRKITQRKYAALNAYVNGASATDGNTLNHEPETGKIQKAILALNALELIKIKTTKKDYQEQNSETIALARNRRGSSYIAMAEDPKYYLMHSCHDMVVNDARGRMLRAFPTFYMMFIDEGRVDGNYKFHDDFYNNMSILEMEVVKSRKMAGDVATIKMTNFYQSFDTPMDVNIDDSILSLGDIYDSIVHSEKFNKEKVEPNRRNKEVESTMRLRPGARIHIRMGYGANPNLMPVLFNGTIAEVNTSEIVDIIAQGDGAELLNPILEDEEAYQLKNKEILFGNVFKNGDTPKNIVDSLLTRSDGIISAVLNKVGLSKLANNNPYGIIHFGDKHFKEIHKEGEPAQNIFEAVKGQAWDMSGKGAMTNGIAAKDESDGAPRITTRMFQKTPWDIINFCRSVTPDAICAVHPFGFRSTVFMGLPRYYLAYDYVKINGILHEKRKPYSQFHFYTSRSDIIGNGITVSTQEMKTAAIGLYEEMGISGRSQERVGPLFIDIDIYPECQRTMIVDTALDGRGIPILEHARFVTVSQFFDAGFDDKGAIFDTEKVAWKMTAAALKDSMKDMYGGDMVVYGDPSVKPHDRMYIMDAINGIDGQALVKDVTHRISVSEGFITTISPDCIIEIEASAEDVSSSWYSNLSHVAGKSMLSAALVVGYLRGSTHIIPTMIADSALAQGAKRLALSGVNAAKNSTVLTRSLGSALKFGKSAIDAGKTIRGVSTVISAGRAIYGAGAMGAALLAAPVMGPVLVSAAVFAAGYFCVSAISNFVEKKVKNAEVGKVYPLRRYGVAWTAGMEGSKGAVKGSPTEHSQGIYQQFLAKFFGRRNDGTDSAIGSVLQELFLTRETIDTATKWSTESNQDSVENEKKNGDDAFAKQVLRLMSEGVDNNSSGNKQDYRKLQMAPRVDMSSGEDIMKAYNFFAINNIDHVDTAPTLSKHMLISDYARLNPYLQSGFLKLLHNIPTLNNGSVAVEKPIKLNKSSRMVKMITIEEGGKTVYDAPILNEEAIFILHEIIRRAKNSMPDAGKTDQFEEYDSTKASYIVLESAMRIGDDASQAAAGFTFILTGVRAAAAPLGNAIKELHDEIQKDHGINNILNEEVFDVKTMGANKYAIVVRMPKIDDVTLRRIANAKEEEAKRENAISKSQEANAEKLKTSENGGSY